jgi:methyl-accepting chemotaxis protein
LYEVRAGRAKLESQIAESKKQSNDALYEVRQGRAKLEQQIFLEKQVNQKQESSISNIANQLKQVLGSAANGASNSVAQTIQAVKQEIAIVKTQQQKIETRLSFQEKILQPVQQTVKVVQQAVQKLETQPPTWGVQIREATIRTSQDLSQFRNDFTRVWEPKLAEVRQSWFSTSARVDNLQQAVPTLAGGISAVGERVNAVDKKAEEAKKIASQGSPSAATALAEVRDLKIKVNRIDDEVQVVKKDLTQVNQRVKDRENVDKQANDKLNNLDRKITNLIPTIMGIPLVVGKAADTITRQIPTIPQIESAAQTGTCRSLNGGCSGNPLGGLESRINQNTNNAANNILDGLNTGANAAQLGMLQEILDRLGAKLPGGISTFLQNFLTRFNKVAQWLHLDRALNILIWWQTLHNAYMLSSNLGQTLTSATSNVLAAIGIKDAEGQPLDIGAIVGKTLDNAAKTALGEKTWGGMKAEWRRYNRIYQAAANLLNAVQSIGQSILSALEIVGSWIAGIGNALRKFGEVSDRAYQWMNPQPNFQNKFFTALETAENVVSQVDAIASEVLSVQETLKQIGETQEELNNAIKQTDNSKQGQEAPEAEKIKQAAEASKTASQSPAIPQISSDADKEADD